MADSSELGRLIRFRLRTAVLVGDLVLFEELGHFFSHDICIILNGDERDFFPNLRCFLRRRLVGLFRLISHSNQYTPAEAGTVGLFKGFQRRFFRELSFTTLARHEVIGVPHGQRGSQIEAYPTVIARSTGNLFQP